MVSLLTASCALLSSFVYVAFAQYSANASATCRYLPGDEGWPSSKGWTQLNKTVSGRLIATVPGGYVCHDPKYDASACAALQQSWPYPQTQCVTMLPLAQLSIIRSTRFLTPSGFMATLFQNATCDPPVYITQSDMRARELRRICDQRNGSGRCDCGVEICAREERATCR
jgi:hypothetical protein